MREEKNKIPFKRKVIISLIVFAVSYFSFLILWINIQDYYGKFLLQIASNISAKVKNIDFETIKLKEDGQLGAQFYVFRKRKGVRFIFNFDFSTFTYNAPLTFAIMSSLYLFIKKRMRAYSEALLILFSIHFFYVFTSEVGRLSYILVKNHVETASELYLFIWQFLWGFIDALFIRFEPFLIGLYIYLRFSSSSSRT